MSTAQEARALADALRAEYLDGVLSAETLPRAAAMLEAQAAQIERLQAEVQSWRDTLSAVMPADLKDWHENDPAEWPQIAADLIGNLRTSDAVAWEGVEVMARDLDRVTAERDILRADAERYRWLRDSDSTEWCVAVWDWSDMDWVRDARDAAVVDAAIDAARAALAAKEQPR